MQIKIFWQDSKAQELLDLVNESIEDLWLSDFIKSELTQDEFIKSELNITKEPALIIEEESIDFKDMIFEWIIPEKDEIKSMFISIIWWWEGSSWGCWGWSCWSGCSC